MDEYKSDETLASAPSATITVDAIQQDVVDFTVTSSAAGAVSFILVEGAGATAPDGEDLLTLNVADVLEDGSAMLEGDTRSQSFTIGGAGKELDHNTTYTLFAVSANTEGIWSTVVAQEILTGDETNPELESVSPDVTNDPEVAVDAEFVLTFSESVKLDPTKKFTIGYYEEGVEVELTEDLIEVSGNTVTLAQPRTAEYNVLVYISYEAGAVTDLVGNPVAAMESGVIDGYLEGLYFVTVQNSVPVSTENITPAIQTAQSDLSTLTITFDEDVFLSDDYSEGDISVSIYGIIDGSPFEKIIDIASDFISTSGMVATITLPEEPDFGEKVALNIAEGALVDVFGNPVEAFESTEAENAWWLKSYNRDINVLVGTYEVTGVNYSGDNYLETLTIALDPENENQVIITGFAGGNAEVVGVFNKDFSTLSIAEPDAPVYVEDGVFELYLSWFYEPMEGFVGADGSMSIRFAYYYVDLVDSGNTGWYTDYVFNSATWTKVINPPAATLKSGRTIDFSQKGKKI